MNVSRGSRRLLGPLNLVVSRHKLRWIASLIEHGPGRSKRPGLCVFSESFSSHVADQSTTSKFGTRLRSLSFVTTAQFPSANAMAAI